VDEQIVLSQERVESLGPFLVVRICLGVCPLVGHNLDEGLGFAVDLRMAGLGLERPDSATFQLRE
jgi:hypothetical protein